MRLTPPLPGLLPVILGQVSFAYRAEQPRRSASPSCPPSTTIWNYRAKRYRAAANSGKGESCPGTAIIFAKDDRERSELGRFGAPGHSFVARPASDLTEALTWWPSSLPTLGDDPVGVFEDGLFHYDHSVAKPDFVAKQLVRRRSDL
jgi:hypothetical protein